VNVLNAQSTTDANELIRGVIQLSRRLPPKLYTALTQHVTNVTAVLEQLPIVL
jgi:hypothetical protein